MQKLNFLCKRQSAWVMNNPLLAAKDLPKLETKACAILKQRDYEGALHHVGEAYEISIILFVQELPSPRLTILLTTFTVMLSEIYSAMACGNKAAALLNHTRLTLEKAIERAPIYLSKNIVFRHCANILLEARKELGMQTNIKQEMILPAVFH